MTLGFIIRQQYNSVADIIQSLGIREALEVFLPEGSPALIELQRLVRAGVVREATAKALIQIFWNVDKQFNVSDKQSFGVLAHVVVARYHALGAEDLREAAHFVSLLTKTHSSWDILMGALEELRRRNYAFDTPFQRLEFTLKSKRFTEVFSSYYESGKITADELSKLERLVGLAALRFKQHTPESRKVLVEDLISGLNPFLELSLGTAIEAYFFLFDYLKDLGIYGNDRLPENGVLSALKAGFVAKVGGIDDLDLTYKMLSIAESVLSPEL